MMNFFNKWLLICFVFFAIIFFISWETSPKAEDTVECLSCHTYEAVQELTENYSYKGQKLQPHVYLDMSRQNPHDTTKEVDCLICHDEHELPEPISPVKTPNLDYCINCHHTGEMLSCGECHAGE